MPDDGEGSVDVDGLGFDNEGESTSENAPDTENQDQGDAAKGKTGDPGKGTEGAAAGAGKGTQAQDGAGKGEGDKGKLTDKGTKLDPDPNSALNQELANARRDLDDFTTILNDPEALVKYAATMGLKLTKAQAEDAQDGVTTPKPGEKEMRIEDVQTTEDLQKFLTQERGKDQQRLNEAIDMVKKQHGELSRTAQLTAIGTNLRNDVSAVREEFPELDPNNEAYNQKLENGIGDMFHALDFDPKTKSYRGSISLKAVTERVMALVKVGHEQGSAAAQTIVKDRRGGKVTTGAGDTAKDESGMNPAQIIAQRMQNAGLRRRR